LERSLLRLQVAKRGADGLRGERRFAGVGHHIHADGLAGFGIRVGGHTGFQHDWAGRVGDVLQIRRHAGAAENRDRLFPALQSVGRIEIAGRGIADYFNRKFGLHVVWRPRQRNANQAAVQQQRMG